MAILTTARRPGVHAAYSRLAFAGALATSRLLVRAGLPSRINSVEEFIVQLAKLALRTFKTNTHSRIRHRWQNTSKTPRGREPGISSYPASSANWRTITEAVVTPTASAA